jgi:hypothetical protein
MLYFLLLVTLVIPKLQELKINITIRSETRGHRNNNDVRCGSVFASVTRCCLQECITVHRFPRKRYLCVGNSDKRTITDITARDTTVNQRLAGLCLKGRTGDEYKYMCQLDNYCVVK